MSEREYLIAKAERSMREGRRRDTTGAMLGGGSLAAGAAAFGADAAANRYMDMSNRSNSLMMQSQRSAKDVYSNDRQLADSRRQFTGAAERSRVSVAQVFQAKEDAKRKIRADYRDYLREGSAKHERARVNAKGAAGHSMDAAHWYRRQSREPESSSLARAHASYYGRTRSSDMYRNYLKLGTKAHGIRTQFKSDQSGIADKLKRSNAAVIDTTNRNVARAKENLNRSIDEMNSANAAIERRSAELRPESDRHAAASNKHGMDAKKHLRRGDRLRSGSKVAVVASGALGTGYLLRAGYKGAQRRDGRA